MIRKAKVEDWPQLVTLGERLLEKTPYRDLKLDREQTMHVYGNCLSSALGFAMVAEQDGEITGLLLGLVDRLWWSKARYASDLIFYCEDKKSGALLLKAFIEWAWTIPGVVEVTCAQSSGIKRADALYQRYGFEQVGGLWTIQKEIGK